MIMDSVTLFTDKRPDELMPFYRDVLGLPIRESAENRFTVQTGYTSLTFLHQPADTGTAPYYHFAINIPENKLDEAKRWIESRVEIGSEDGEDISYSELWDSHSVYFLDTAGNILELIARHTMDNAVDRPFDPKRDLLGISEMGMPTKDVPRAVDELEALGIPTYKRRDSVFNPVGDEEGILIVVKPGRRWHFTNLTAECFPFQANVKGIGPLTLEEDESGLVIRRESILG
ncbi:ring-cleaving dioxygenase [Paenibacillus sp. 1011MAR3C5]|uniref:VOC family protein n=1 Tax=Paenibacillus sp. 1011MAR3C5 TaxID=1675787 RepID=UPI000E6CAC72|nr:VOC family protein [Paenibacillus sp. 1011MAR3C5]RJE86041.1 ring-cleaving dioxygenase [Paenibacillus sp. 1011MAR3C5]